MGRDIDRGFASTRRRRAHRRDRSLPARAWRSLIGPAALAPLSVAHGLAAAGDAFVTVSLAGSLFFNVSADASRSQVLLYLIVTMVLFAVLAPLVGPTWLGGAPRRLRCQRERAAAPVRLLVARADLVNEAITATLPRSLATLWRCRRSLRLPSSMHGG
jgi:hypothetical protein